MKLTEEEKQIERDADQLRPVTGDKRERIEKIIRGAKKNKAISLRISGFDLERLKAKAARDGVPYQTLITMVLHKYVTNQLFEKDEVLKSVLLLRESK